MSFRTLILGAAALVLLAACNQAYEDIPPNDIGMMLTPSGYENRIYSPGQANIQKLNFGNQGNKLVLIQRSGIQVKEQFLRTSSEDQEDHRCLTGDRAPMTLDVRLLFALPDYETEQGKKDLNRIFTLGNPQRLAGNDRVVEIKADDIYNEQARQAVRGKIRQICASYANFDAAFAAFSDTGPGGLTSRIEGSVADVLRQTYVPLRLVSAFPSNLKPDQTVIDAIAAQLAAEKRVEALKTITDFIGADPSGARAMVYQMQATQEIVSKANANGHDTVVLAPGAQGLFLRR